MKAYHLIITFLVGVLLVSSAKRHEYYVSVTNVEYAKKNKSIQIISQIFIDDLEELLHKRYNESIALDPDNDAMMIDSYIQEYLTDRLQIYVNGSAKQFNFLGKEYKEDITYCYLEINNVESVKSVKLTNKILFDVYSQQQNIVRFKVHDKNKSFLLILGNDECMLNFD